MPVINKVSFEDEINKGVFLGTANTVGSLILPFLFKNKNKKNLKTRSTV